MCQYFGPVDTFPPEAVVRVLVHLAPGEFLRHEVVDTGLLHELWQRTRITKDVREPQVSDVHAKLLSEEALAIEKLAYQRFTSTDVRIGFHPHRALHFPAPFGDALLD